MATEGYVVFVQDQNGEPLMPTHRFGKVRRMLKNGKAKVVRRKPFTIRLLYETETHITQDIGAGMDPGRTNIGIAAEQNGQCIFAAHCTTNNKDVTKHMSDRKAHRQASRRGERLARKRLAKKNGTECQENLSTPDYVGMVWDENQRRFRAAIRRMLPGCNKPSEMKDIRNIESRFNNRVREAGWLTPTARHLLQTCENLVDIVCSILPVRTFSLEINKFAFMALEDPTIWQHPENFQNGPLKGYNGAHEAVNAMQEGKCLVCKKALIEHYHHVIPRSKGGSDTFENLAGLCNKCHDKIHKDAAAYEKMEKKHSARNKKYAAASVLNQIIPSLDKFLAERFGERYHRTTGWITKEFRVTHHLNKTHDTDAYCIAMSAYGDHVPAVSESFPETYEVVQFRRQNRARINCQTERTYYLGKEKVATNRHKRMEQKTDSLEEWYNRQVDLFGVEQAERMRSQLTVKKSMRSYNNLERILPGAAFRYGNKVYVLKGQKSNGQQYRPYGENGQYFPASQCKILTHNAGLVFV